MKSLSENYFEYMELHHKIRNQTKLRKVVSMLLHKIEKPGNCLSSFERNYVNWIVSLKEKNIDRQAIKTEIKKLAQSFKGAKLHHLEKDVIRFTKLCALKAALKGKLHFSPRTNIAESIFYRKIAVKNRSFDPKATQWLGLIDLEVQMEWVKDLAEEFCKGEKNV